MAGLRSAANNATKTGAYAVQVVLPGENASQFEDLEAQLMFDFEPVGMAEVAMVHDLAVLTWKRLRVDRVEHSVMLQMMQLPLLEDDVAQSYGPGFLSRAMYRLEPYEEVTTDEWNDAVELSKQLHALQLAPDSSFKVAVIRRKWPQAFAVLVRWADDYDVDIDDVIAGVPTAAPNCEDAIVELLRDTTTVLWLAKNREAIEAAIRRVRDSRLLRYMKSNNTQRAYDDIGRAFYRTLAELRRQQDWRSRRSAILVDDATPKPASVSPDATPAPDSADQTDSHLGGLLK
jgi:hypothetical protein